jgi:hypothetical protein
LAPKQKESCRKNEREILRFKVDNYSLLASLQGRFGGKYIRSFLYRTNGKGIKEIKQATYHMIGQTVIRFAFTS